MVVANSPEPRKGTAKETRSSNTAINLLMILAAASAFVTLISIFGPTLYLVQQQQQHSRSHHSISSETVSVQPTRVRTGSAPSQPIQKTTELVIVEVEDLEHEDIFYKTIKSCTERKKCKEFVPDPTAGKGGKKVQRVALIAPPGDISSSLMNRLEQVMVQHNHQSNKDNLDIDVIETTHVPPYGYGKTHGWTKLVRLVPQPLTLEVTDALQNVLEYGESHRNITLQDLKAGMRQILRFHCRISHVAAHTATLSVPFMDLLRDPSAVTDEIQSFLAPGDKIQPKGEDDDTLSESFADDDQGGLFDAEESYGTQMLTYIQSVSGGINVNKVLDEVLLDEMQKTKNMTKWPCLSFWAAGDEPNPLEISPIVQRLAKRLSPDCSAPFASCFVARDKCEEKGDGICKGNKR